MFSFISRALVTGLGMMVGRLVSLSGVNLVGNIIVKHCSATFYGWTVYVCSKCLLFLALFLWLISIMVTAMRLVWAHSFTKIDFLMDIAPTLHGSHCWVIYIRYRWSVCDMSLSRQLGSMARIRQTAWRVRVLPVPSANKAKILYKLYPSTLDLC